MCLINGHRSSVKNAHSITPGIEKPGLFVLHGGHAAGRHRDINQAKWNSTRHTRILGPNWTISHIVVTLLPCANAEAQVLPRTPPPTPTPKNHFESTQLSAASQRLRSQLVSSEAATLCLYFLSGGGTSYSRRRSVFNIWFGLIVLYTGSTRKDVKLANRETFIPVTCVLKMPPRVNSEGE